jgi:hypothetical protein
MTMRYLSEDDDGRVVAVHHDGGTRCGQYRAGHDPHWIQVLSVAPNHGTPVAVHDLRLVDTVTFELDVDTRDGTGRETLVRQNHAAIQVAATWQNHRQGLLVHGASLLQIGPPTGMASFSATDRELGPCGPRQDDASRRPDGRRRPPSVRWWSTAWGSAAGFAVRCGRSLRVACRRVLGWRDVPTSGGGAQ